MLHSTAARLVWALVAVVALAACTPTGNPRVAATVGDTQITSAELSAEVDAAMDGMPDDPAQRLAIQTQVLQQRIAELAMPDEPPTIAAFFEWAGVDEPTDDQIERAREQLILQVGGEEAFEEAVATEGLTDEELDTIIVESAQIEMLLAELGEEGLVAAQEEFLIGLGPEVQVNPRYGSYDPATGQLNVDRPLSAPQAPDQPDLDGLEFQPDPQS